MEKTKVQMGYNGMTNNETINPEQVIIIKKWIYENFNKGIFAQDLHWTKELEKWKDNETHFFNALDSCMTTAYQIYKFAHLCTTNGTRLKFKNDTIYLKGHGCVLSQPFTVSSNIPIMFEVPSGCTRAGRRITTNSCPFQALKEQTLTQRSTKETINEHYRFEFNTDEYFVTGLRFYVMIGLTPLHIKDAVNIGGQIDYNTNSWNIMLSEINDNVLPLIKKIQISSCRGYRDKYGNSPEVLEFLNRIVPTSVKIALCIPEQLVYSTNNSMTGTSSGVIGTSSNMLGKFRYSKLKRQDLSNILKMHNAYSWMNIQKFLNTFKPHFRQNFQELVHGKYNITINDKRYEIPFGNPHNNNMINKDKKSIETYLKQKYPNSTIFIKTRILHQIPIPNMIKGLKRQREIEGTTICSKKKC